ncbi:cell cycle checkpoint protein rad1 [Chrysochromulina tobinii]|jgi:hypothetical protein|uniref:Cell cycle checkpoint protein rad1 n=1 Tax=Chrysochromulina tobinii TaxID=1460289 RepID=A0A0M0JEP9_9EUKA|nr:cell cycle checkpoint protein rad1 [Chrysochromulina tobinii]|eukprot:KOO25061.1 cell cycle checkpoint protein rad1 [Chrysochromulina sp. CCMP291]
MENDSDDERDDICFEARTDDARRITSILSSICVATSRKADSSASLAWCEVSDTGLTFTVNVSKTLQAIAYVKRKGVFHTWELAMPHRGEVPDERLEFGINLATLLECLKIFGGAAAPNAFERSQTALHISFREGTRCLCLQLNEKASVTECEIHSLEIDQPHKTELKVREGERPPARLVVSSDALKNGIDELEWGGEASRDKRVLLRVSAPSASGPGGLSLTVSSTDVGCEMVYPPEALVSFDVRQDLSFEYRFLHMHMALRSLRDSHQTLLQLDENGTLEIKLRFASSAAANAAELFSHFFLFPLTDEDDIDDEDATASKAAGGGGGGGARDQFDAFD